MAVGLGVGVAVPVGVGVAVEVGVGVGVTLGVGETVGDAVAWVLGAGAPFNLAQITMCEIALSPVLPPGSKMPLALMSANTRCPG